MKVIISISILFFTVQCFAQAPDSTIQKLDTINVSEQIRLILPDLLTEREQLEKAIKENTDKLILIISAYADPKNFAGFTEDRKQLIIKK